MRKSGFLILCSLILLSIPTIYSCTVTGKQSVDEISIDWEKFLSKCDLVWDNLVCFYDTVPEDYKPPYNQKYHKGWDSGAFTGNGMIGAMIYKDDTQRLRFQLGRNDVTAHYHLQGVDWTIPRLMIGDFFLKPKGKITDESMRLDLWNAEARGKTVTDKGEISWRSFTHATEMVMTVEINTNGNESGADFDFVPEWGRSPRVNYYTDEQMKDLKFPPKPVVEKTGDISTSVQKLTEKGEYAVAWSKEERGNGKTIYYISIENSYPGYSAKSKAVANVKKGMEIGYDKLLKSHRDWWHGYYPQSFVSISDEKWEKFYWIQIYKLASAGRENSPVIDNQGPWLTDTPWPGTWWNLNVQLCYSPLYASNRLSIAKSLSNNLFAKAENLKIGVPDSLKGQDIAYMGRCTTDDFISSTRLFELGNLTWALHNVWREYKYSMDDSMMVNQLFPLLKSAVNFYLAIMKKGDDGYYHLPPTLSPEYKRTLHMEDCNYSLGLMRWGLMTLLEANERYNLNDPLKENWNNTLENLVPYQVDNSGFMIGKDTPLEISHRHYSHMIMFYPLHILRGEASEERELLEKSLKHWIEFEGALQGYSYTGAAGMVASMGNGNKALEYLNGLLRYCSYNTMYSEAGPVIETPVSAAESIHEMLLQSWGGSIRIFPAVPDKWEDVVFKNLRTEGAFLISAERKEGNTKWIKIKSLAGEELIVESSNIGNFRAETTGNRPLTVENLGNNQIRIDLKKGEEVSLIAPPTAKEMDQIAIEKAKNGWWKKSMETRDERIAWWKEARFGMFVHWGVYSVPAGEWKGHIARPYSEHLMRIEKIPLKEYREKIAAPFNPVDFDADEWIKSAKDAGMKYFVITAKHHDGFAMYDSEVSEYNIVDASAFKRDPMIELKKACKKYGIKFGFYYSHAFDWEHPDAPGNDWDYDNPGGGRNLYGGRRYYDVHPETVPWMAKYVDQKSIPQIKELLIKYEPDIIWFDTPHKLAFFENLRILEEVRKISPDIVVNGRLAGGFGDYQNTADDPFEFFPTNAMYWEAIPTTNESYGYHKHDNSHKPASFFVRLLAKSASRGGNLLMNIGPMGNGKFDPKDSKILEGIGNWLTKNGESIYGTDKTPLPLQSWGVTTQKEDNLYLHVFNWPENGKLILGGLKSNFGRAYLLADDNSPELSSKRLSNENVEITLPANAPDTINTVVVLKLKEPVIAGDIPLLSSSSVNQLLAFDAKLNGKGLKFGNGQKNSYYVYNWSEQNQSLSWDFKMKEEADFDVIVKYQATDKSGGDFKVSFNGKDLSGSVEPAENKKTNKEVNLGRIKANRGMNDLIISPVNISGSELMRIFEIILKPTQSI